MAANVTAFLKFTAVAATVSGSQCHSLLDSVSHSLLAIDRSRGAALVLGSFLSDSARALRRKIGPERDAEGGYN